MKDAIKSKRTELATLTNQAKTLYAEMETAGDKATADDRQKFSNLIEAGKAKRNEVEQLEALDANDETAGHGEAKGRAQDVPGGQPQQPTRAKSWGEQVIGSTQFKSNNRDRMERVLVDAPVKALVTGITGAAGVMPVQTQRLPEMVGLPQRQITVLNYINLSQTVSNAVEYIKQGTRVNNAATVAEAGTVAGATTKPESDLTFTLVTAGVKTIATWIPVTRQILEDAPRMRDMIDNELSYLLQDRLEAQIIAGDGTGSNFTGLLNTSGIQSRVHAVSGRAFAASDTIVDTLRRSLTDLQMEFYNADVILCHPATAEKMELLKDTTGQYIRVYDPITLSLWRTPIVPTVAVPSGTAITMQGKLAATLWDRSQTEIRVGEPNAYFLQNLLAILAEMRAAFGVTRPLAVEKITGL